MAQDLITTTLAEAKIGESLNSQWDPVSGNPVKVQPLQASSLEPTIKLVFTVQTAEPKYDASFGQNFENSKHDLLSSMCC